MKRSKKQILWVILIILLLGIVLGTTSKSQSSVIKDAPQLGTITIAQPLAKRALSTPNDANIEKLVNDYRIRLGLPSLVHNEAVCTATESKLEDMISKQYFEHDSPDGKKFFDFLKEKGVPYRRAGENLSVNSNATQPDRVIVDAWIASEGHRQNMIGDFTDTCVESGYFGSYLSYEDAYFTVQYFIQAN